MKPNLILNLTAASAAIFLGLSGKSTAVTLVEIDFSGSGGVGTLASSDSQFTVVNSTVTFVTPASAFASIGGSSGTNAWAYDGTGTAATNADLHTASTFGNPTRFDLDIGLASAGNSYTVTSVELDIRASNSAGTTWEFGYRDSSDNTQLVGTQLISTQSGADSIGTYSIDLTSAGLTATDSTTTWSTAGNGKFRWTFFEPTATGNDNFQVAGIRVIGTVVPEPSSAMLLGLAGTGILLLRRRN